MSACTHAWAAHGCAYGITHRELRTCAVSLFSQGKHHPHNEGRTFAEPVAANLDIALVDLQGVDLSPYVDVLGVSDELRGNRAILAHVQAQRIAQQRVKSAKGGTR
jgi:hypothetical protein